MSTVHAGKAAEDLACRALAQRGYEILARGYRTKAGEIDIVARDGMTFVFVEVKMRTAATYGRPAEAVHARKQHRVAVMAVDYLSRHRLVGVPCRFDVVTVSPFGEGQLEVEIIRGAFDAPAGV